MKLNARNTAELLQIFRDENTFDKTLRKIKEFMEELSEGQKKKMLIAASLITPAHLYIWDEILV